MKEHSNHGAPNALAKKPGDPLDSPTITLSICISTYNRAAFIGATLESICSQLGRNCEVVIVDGASNDGTERVVSQYVQRFDNVRYARQETNHGIDRDYDRAVQLARGCYCWLMTDDDLLKPQAIPKVLAVLHDGISAVLVNYQRFDNTMTEVVLARFLEVYEDIRYRPHEIDRMFTDTSQLLGYIGSLIIKRSIWMERERERYFDTMLMHIAVLFQAALPGDALLIAEPQICYRDGNPRTFWARMFEIFLVKLPATVASLAISDDEKQKYRLEKLWSPASLFTYRAMGWYSIQEYRRWIGPNLPSVHRRILSWLIALTPGLLVNTIYIVLERVRRTRWRDVTILHLRMSPFYYRNYHPLRQRRG